MNSISLRIPDDDLNTMSDEEQLQRLSDCFRITVAGVTEAARILAWREANGKDMARFYAVAGPWLAWLRLVPNQLLAELVCNYFSRPKALNLFATLPTTDQKRVVADEPLLLLALDQASMTPTKSLYPTSLLVTKQDQFDQVFKKGGIRSEAEQRLYLDAQLKKAKKPLTSAIGIMKLDDERDGVMVGRTFISRTDLKTAVRELEKRIAS